MIIPLSRDLLLYASSNPTTFTAPFQAEYNGEELARGERPLHAGNYYIVTTSMITVTDKAIFRRLGLGTWYRAPSFSDEVRARDKICVISGRQVWLAGYENWETFHACHVYPLQFEQQWLDKGYSRWITISPSNESDGIINSIQNGLLLGREIHLLFDSFKLSINPEENFKIVCFAPDTLYYNVAGRHLDQALLDHPHCPVNQVLRWHFLQAVLVYMRAGGGDSSWIDFPSSFDILGGAGDCESGGGNAVWAVWPY
ncbi:hypothetical protein B9Z19DRAFT_1125740 [Tuber borchii]|uniref:HNH nuclease domain-containing protein n=1 Tax=Tuber borchii TaxID=42251 RepID=A0A2T6ZU49_TUBBO|nr:hypothetical protein B9Z19DRAFT_1125740 [Tuber borchii]